MTYITNREKSLTAAAQLYQDRQARVKHPAGKFDNANRFTPTNEEWQDCCRYIRTPSRQFPNSYNTHCRSVEHIAQLENVDALTLRRLIRLAEESKTTPLAAIPLLRQKLEKKGKPVQAWLDKLDDLGLFADMSTLEKHIEAAPAGAPIWRVEEVVETRSQFLQAA